MYDPVDVSENFSLKKASGLKRGCGPPPPPDPPLSNSIRHVRGLNGYGLLNRV